MNGSLTLRSVDRDEVQRWLPQIDAWLLPGSYYSVQHTWPQLYRQDGDGAFFVLTDGDQLLSHCACRMVTLRDPAGSSAIALIGSVVTDPDHRGEGLASRVLDAAIEAMAPQVSHLLLWAERPELYERCGFVPTADDVGLLLARKPRRPVDGVRLAEIRDHGTLHGLHHQKPCHVERSKSTMSTLLTTPGMTTFVLERNGLPVAYACCGKGADLHGHWHELGGSDADLAMLLPEAMHLAEQIEAALLLPPYRSRLRELLDEQVVGEIAVAGPMARSADRAVHRFWIDGLDSV